MNDLIPISEAKDSLKVLTIKQINIYIRVIANKFYLSRSEVLSIINHYYPDWENTGLNTENVDRIMTNCLYYREGRDKNLPINFVYIAHMTNTPDVYKIGVTKDIEKRRKSLKTGNPFLSIIASIKTKYAFELEGELHKELKENNMSGEWFNVGEDDIDRIVNRDKFNIHIE
jgi:hypothetical protein